MTSRQDILDRFTDQAAASPLYLPDLTLWYKWHRGRGSLPQGWDTYTLPAAARALGVPAWTVARPWRATTPGIRVVTEDSSDERIIRHEVLDRVLTARWTLGPEGDWWQAEYPVKTIDDLAAARGG